MSRSAPCLSHWACPVVSKAFDICQAQDTYLGGFGKISEKKVAVVTELLDKADALLEQGI